MTQEEIAIVIFVFVAGWIAGNLNGRRENEKSKRIK